MKLRKHKPDTFWPRDRKRFEAGRGALGQGTGLLEAGLAEEGAGVSGQDMDMPDVVTRESVSVACAEPQSKSGSREG